MDISTADGGQQAVTALGQAVSKLGTAQAAIGKGQNQLGYAISLANSQIATSPPRKRRFAMPTWRRKRRI